MAADARSLQNRPARSAPAFIRSAQITGRLLARDAAIFFRNRLAIIGVTLLAVFALMSIAHPILLATIWKRGVYNPETGFDMDVVPWPAPPSPGHWLGVDTLGRDILSMLLASTRPAFALALTAAVMTAIVGPLIGAVSAYARGVVDLLLSTLADAMLLMPVPVIMVIIGSAYYDEITTIQFGLLYGLLAGLGSVAIIMRSYALKIMALPFIEAARVSGAGAGHIIFRHLIPYMLPLVAVHMMFSAVGAVVADGFVGFIGYRTQLRLSWGSMIYNSIAFLAINPEIPWMQIVAPTLALSLFAAALYCVARGLHDVADPHLRGR